MAVDENMRGSRLWELYSRALEAARLRRGARKVMLNACENAMELYARHGYAVVGEARSAFRCDSPCADGKVAVIKCYSITA